MCIVDTSVVDNCLYSTLQQCYTQRARNQMFCPRVGNPTNLQVRWYAAMPTSFRRIKKSKYSKQISALDPSNTKGFPVGTVTISGETSCVSRHAAVEILRNYFQINVIDTFDQNSCQYEGFLWSCSSTSP